MELRFTVAGRIARPVDEVFEAVVAPEQLSRYFTTGGASGRIEAGATVWWEFADFPGSFPVEVVEVVPPRRIVLRWEAADGAVSGGAASGDGPEAGPDAGPGRDTTITLTFEPLEDDRTLVRITEEAWSLTEPGRDAAFGNCEGWTNALCCLKAWLEHGIVLREGYYA